MPKLCKYCGESNENKFSKTEITRCKTCRRVEARTWRYGMSWEDSLIFESKKHCDICEQSFNGQGKHTEHDHDTGRVRGVVCPTCNMFLAKVDNNKNVITKLIKYTNAKII